MAKFLNDEEVAIVYVSRFREYGIKILDGGSSFQIIHYCPWCGKKLPPSLRDMWFDTIFKMGLDVDSKAIPSEFRDEGWWKNKKL